jgi:hypothetical protein
MKNACLHVGTKYNVWKVWSLLFLFVNIYILFNKHTNNSCNVFSGVCQLTPRSKEESSSITCKSSHSRRYQVCFSGHSDFEVVQGPNFNLWRKYFLFVVLSKFSTINVVVGIKDDFFWFLHIWDCYTHHQCINIEFVWYSDYFGRHRNNLIYWVLF